MIRILLISLLLTGCGGSSSDTKPVTDDYVSSLSGCLANERNCSYVDVDLNAPVIWAADNGIKIVHIRWFGCSDEETSKYAFEQGVTIICLAGSGGQEISNSPYTITVGSTWEGSNYGVDYVMGHKGTIHSGIWATALISTGQPLGDFEWSGYPDEPWVSDETVLIVDNGFDHRTIYTLYKNPMLAGEVTGDYGIKALNELSRWVDVDVIGYVPFNTLPEEPRIDGWEIL